MALRDRANRIIKRHPKHPVVRLLHWAGKRHPVRRLRAGYRALQQHERYARARRQYKRARFWMVKKVFVRSKYQAAVRRHRRRPDDPVGFETYMLNGHSGNISDGLKAVIAFAVVAKGAAVTDTYDYCCHASSSYHYPRNNPDGKGHAVDLVPATCDLMTSIRDRFGAAFFKELFGPCPFYYKFGTQYGGMFPGHGTHTHAAPAS
jgi:hypothetical protein